MRHRGVRPLLCKSVVLAWEVSSQQTMSSIGAWIRIETFPLSLMTILFDCNMPKTGLVLERPYSNRRLLRSCYARLLCGFEASYLADVGESTQLQYSKRPQKLVFHPSSTST